jgi:hypothetical protein
MSKSIRKPDVALVYSRVIYSEVEGEDHRWKTVRSQHKTLPKKHNERTGGVDPVVDCCLANARP